MNLTDALGGTLLNFLWQGAIVAAILAGALVVLRDASSRVRYAMSCAAMALMPVCALVTFLQLERGGAVAPLDSRSLIDAAQTLPVSLVTNYLQLLVWAWLAGVIALSLRSIGGWAIAVRFSRRQTSEPDAMWQERFAAIARRLRVRRPIQLAVSAIAEVPAAIGWLRPIVLVPASVFTGLAASQIEALLVHELAHVRRNDYLINLLQTAIETLLFYHPAVWWVGRQIRTERENCCDDLAVEICGNTLVYAGALTELEQMRHGAPRFAMAATGGSLLERIQRLLRAKQSSRRTSIALISCLPIVAALLVAGVTGHILAQRAEETPAPEAVNATAEQAVPVPAATSRTGKTWLDEIEEAGFRGLEVGEAIAFKSQGIDANYIREIRSTGLNPTAGELIAFRGQGVTAEFIREAKTHFKDIEAGEIIALKSQGILDPQ